jgi:O-Antigen ligase
MRDAPRSRTLPGASHGTDAYELSAAVLLLMLIAALDAFNFFDRPNGGLRYTILVIPIAAVVMVRSRRPSLIVRKPTPSHVLLSALFIFGFAGALIGVALRGNLANDYPVFVPMAVGLMFIFAVDGPTNDEVHRLLDRLAFVGLVYVLMNFAVNTHLLPGFTHYLKYRNASAAIVAMAFTAAIVRRRWRRVALLTILYAAIFVTYPSATQALMAVTVVLTLMLTTRRSGPTRTLVFAMVVVLFVALALANFSTGIQLTNAYFSGVNKSNSNNGRLSLWTDGIDEFLASPVIGQAFTGESIAIRSRDSKALPFHNDFVLFLAQGGAVGFGLLLAWVMLTELTLLRRYRAFREAGLADAADLTRIILVTLNCFFVAMAFNPVLEGVTRTASLFGLYGIAMSLGAPEAAIPQEEDATAELRSV